MTIQVTAHIIKPDYMQQQQQCTECKNKLEQNTNPKSWLCVTLPDILELVKLEAAINKDKTQQN